MCMFVHACGVHVYKCVYFQVCAEARGQPYVSPSVVTHFGILTGCLRGQGLSNSEILWEPPDFSFSSTGSTAMCRQTGLRGFISLCVLEIALRSQSAVFFLCHLSPQSHVFMGYPPQQVRVRHESGVTHLEDRHLPTPQYSSPVLILFPPRERVILADG